MAFSTRIKASREPVLDEDERVAIIEAATENRDLTAAEIARDEQLNAKGVSASTVERLLNEAGLKCRRKRVMQDISEKNKREREVQAGKALLQVDERAHEQDLLL